MLILLPVKSFHCAKTRLSGALQDTERASLAEALFEDTLDVLQRFEGVRTVVVTEGPRARAIAAKRDVETVLECETYGLNVAVEQALTHLAPEPTCGIVILPADLPYLTASAFEKLLRQPGPVIAPDEEGSGTNSLKFSYGRRPKLQFGEASAYLHNRALGAETAVLKDPCLAFDLDTPDDWSRLLPGKCGLRLGKLLLDRCVAA